MRFAKYGGDGWGGISFSDLLLEAHRENMLHARAEDSGCEAYYVEVARWSEARNRWEKYCFEKLFDSDSMRDWERCQAVADAINEASKCRDVAWVHHLPSCV